MDPALNAGVWHMALVGKAAAAVGPGAGARRTLRASGACAGGPPGGALLSELHIINRQTGRLQGCLAWLAKTESPPFTGRSDWHRPRAPSAMSRKKMERLSQIRNRRSGHVSFRARLCKDGQFS